jgi:hypothetical protein
LTDIDGLPCGKLPVWFDFDLGEKEWKSGFVCSDHRVSNLLEILKQPQTESRAA